MNCKDFEKKLPDFIDRQMDYLTMKEFIEHRDNCENCREELEIKFLVTEGVQRLEEGDVFDLQNELNGRLGDIRTRMKRYFALMQLGTLAEILGGLAFVLACAWVFIFR